MSKYPDCDLLEPLLVEFQSGPRRWLRSAVATSILALRPRSARLQTARALVDADLVVSKGGFVFVDRPGIHNKITMWLTVFPLIFVSRAGVRRLSRERKIGPFDESSSPTQQVGILRRFSIW